MRAVRLLILTASLVLAHSAVHAADYQPPPPPPPYIPPPPIEFAASWYLRGDIGFSNQQLKTMTNIQDAGNSVTDVGFGFNSAGIFGLGFGYYWNDWLRVDVTGEYRGASDFHGTQIITSGGTTYTDEYRYKKSEWLFMANAYVDLGTWYGFTPFVGAGAGMARINIHGFTDINTPLLGVAFAPDYAKWNFAWAVHAGASYKISKHAYLEFSYRYLDLGSTQSGDIYAYDGTNNIYNPMEIKHLTSHDFRIGLRFNLDACCGYSAPPVVYHQPQYPPPPPVYSPPPQYYPPPPPLRSKG